MGDIVPDTESYFKLGNYTESTVDIIIKATAYALHLNLSIYQKAPVTTYRLYSKTVTMEAQMFI